jgi:hypothetical protein
MHLFSKEHLAASSGIVGAEGPVIFTEHKLLSETWIEFLGSGARDAVKYDIPQEGSQGPVPLKWEPLFAKLSLIPTPYALHLENQILPNRERICSSARKLTQ